MTTTPDLGIPELAQAQATPEITHNEALVLFQALLNGVIDKDLTAPPGSPTEGDAYLINTASPTGAWALYPYRVAIYWGGAWRFLPGNDDAGTPVTMGARQEGLTVWVRDENAWYIWRNSATSPASYDWVMSADVPGQAAAQYNVLGRKSSGAGAWEDCTRTELRIAGTELANTFTLGQTITTPVSVALNLNGDGVSVALRQTRYQSASGAANFDQRKARGSLAVPVAVNVNDLISQNISSGWGGTLFAQGFVAAVTVIEPTPSDTAMGVRWTAEIAPLGSATPAEVIRLEHGTGFSMYGANPVIDNNRIFRPRSYTIGTLPTVTATGIIHCSDLGGGGALLFSDGTGWCRVKPTGTATISVDASLTFTYTRLTNAPVIRANVALTATRTVTLSTTGARNSDRARFVRTSAATGAFNWDIAGGTTKSLTAASTWCEFEFDGTAWNIIAAGSL